jgi:hypothetical protein
MAKKPKAFWAESKNNKKLQKKYGKKVRCGCHDYNLIFCSAIKGEDKETDQDGHCDMQFKNIYIHELSDIPEALIHEIIHGCLYEAGFAQVAKFDSDLEELTCEIIAKCLSFNYRLTPIGKDG